MHLSGQRSRRHPMHRQRCSSKRLSDHHRPRQQRQRRPRKRQLGHRQQSRQHGPLPKTPLLTFLHEKSSQEVKGSRATERRAGLQKESFHRSIFCTSCRCRKDRHRSDPAWEAQCRGSLQRSWERAVADCSFSQQRRAGVALHVRFHFAVGWPLRPCPARLGLPVEPVKLR